MILGISASGRNAVRNEAGLLLCGVTEEMVKYILEKSGEPHEYVSLADKNINGCRGCVRCAGDNVCVIDDDWAEIKDKMLQAEAVVYGAPNYYGSINALGHAFLERTYCLRHRERFLLTGKINAIVTAGSEEDRTVEDYIRKMFRSNLMAEPVGALRAKGLSQCYLCGYGERCAAGSVVATHGFLDEIRDYLLPRLPADTYRRAEVIAHRLGEVVRSNRR